MKAISNGAGKTIDSAFQHVMRRSGWSADEAVYRLSEALLAGRARATCYHFVDGELQASGPVRPDFWRDHLALHLVDGHAEVPALKALAPGVWEYRLPAQAVEALTEIKPTAKPPPRRRGPGGRTIGIQSAARSPVAASIRSVGALWCQRRSSKTCCNGALTSLITNLRPAKCTKPSVGSALSCKKF